MTYIKPLIGNYCASLSISPTPICASPEARLASAPLDFSLSNFIGQPATACVKNEPPTRSLSNICVRFPERVDCFVVGEKTFSDKAVAKRYLDELNAAQKINRLLPTVTRAVEDNFTGGQGYIQHERAQVVDARKGFAQVVREFYGSSISERFPSVDLADDNALIGDELMALFLDDCKSPLYSLQGRLLCIDSDSREWGQLAYMREPHIRDRVRFPYSASVLQRIPPTYLGVYGPMTGYQVGERIYLKRSEAIEALYR